VPDFALAGKSALEGPDWVSHMAPHGLGGRQITKSQPAVPDWSAQKALYDKYAKAAAKH